MDTRSSRVLQTAKIKITTKCNQECGFCIFSSKRGGRDMPIELFKMILQKLKKIQILQLHINGGEPTIHRDFVKISELARGYLGARKLILGSNIIVPANNSPIMNVVIKYYDEILIGCDDEHHNYKHVERALPILRSYGRTVIVNSVLEAISAEKLIWLSKLCEKYGAIHIKNHVHHIDVGQPENILKGLCLKYHNLHLMIQEDGACYRCFNAMSKKDSEFNIFDLDFEEKLFRLRKYHYKFCLKCHEYIDSEARYFSQ